MISRVYFEDFLSFEKVELEFEKGLIVFTGPSGAGKSILMDSFLSLFAYKEARANIGEIIIENSPVENEAFMIAKGDDVVIKATKKDKVRYFLNNQMVSKKNLSDFSQTIVKFLHLKDTSDFESARLIEFLDKFLQCNDAAYNQLKTSFENSYLEYKQVQERLEKIKADEKKIEDLKEFTQFEIEKIASIDPKVDEYEELNAIKRNLSKKDKIQDAINAASGVFAFNTSVSNALDLLEVDSGFFDEAINELNNQFEKFNDSLSELEELDIEYVLDRIEKLSSLQKKFGSIQEALNYKKQKEDELEGYENISFEKSILEKNEKELNKEVKELALEISAKRVESSKHLENKINHYLKHLYLSNAKIHLIEKSVDITGIDRVEFELNGVSLETISSGEFNRLRLALLTSISEFEIVSNGILFLDEIDANLSGKESKAIATVLATLAKSYQIFAISHQPQLTATADQHFFVDKIAGKSTVRKLNKEQRIDEIARMISGENISSDAKQFASNLLSE
ncbi:MAG: AAA family ATPase [Candidatus Marinarcus sp.]|uniref:AAA family ATPase n=1 Tax=Candidatus Marinarcus sp. TaxID=3100987 RepID=UPI003B00D074